MSIAVISTGTELLKGSVVNTNLAYLGRELEAAGLRIRLALTAGDRPSELYTALADALREAQTVIVTGGLGPTDDDLTLDAVARFLGLGLEYHPELTEKVRAFWKLRHGRARVPKQVMRQARCPRGVRPLPNPNGSASGYAIETLYDAKPRRVFLLPGPPGEFKPMVNTYLIPELLGLPEALDREHTRGFLAPGVGEFQLQTNLAKTLDGHPVELAFCATPAGTRVFLSGPDPLAVGGAAEIARGVAGDDALPLGELDLLPLIIKELTQRKWKVATAESCTGGMIAAAITALPGASTVFDGGLVAYSNRVKADLLGVPQDILLQHGAVSIECAEAMAAGAMKTFEADCSVAVTGIAGPGGGTPEKPVGLVCIAAATRDQIRSHAFQFQGDRDTVRDRAAAHAFLMLYRLLRVG